MNDPSSDGNERGADIFILSTDDHVALPLKERLEQRNYRVYVFSDPAVLKETLIERRPDLLICDVTKGQQDGLDVSRQVKADKELRAIPVLILTASSTMEDLLRVLESDADNFIGPPGNLPDQLSLIDGMLTTPFDRQTPDDTKKQFRIRHDDQTYVVAATSRKLLEYLLSSFDVVVSRSSGLSEANSKLRELSGSVNELEQKVTGQAHAIETLNATLRQKEQHIIAMTREQEDLEKTLAQKTDEIGNLVRERDSDRSLISDREETLGAMAREKEGIQAGSPFTNRCPHRQGLVSCGRM